MVRLQIILDLYEAELLTTLPASQLRDPQDQIRLIIRNELIRLGLFEKTEIINSSSPRDSITQHFREVQDE